MIENVNLWLSPGNLTVLKAECLINPCPALLCVGLLTNFIPQKARAKVENVFEPNFTKSYTYQGDTQATS